VDSELKIFFEVVGTFFLILFILGVGVFLLFATILLFAGML